jgi:hypothetical protein
MPAFLPKGSPTYHVVLPPKFGSGSSTVYVWKGSYQDTVDAVNRELRPKGWSMNHLGLDQTVFQGEGQIWVVNGRLMNPRSFVDRAQKKNEALSTSWESGGGYVSVQINREDGSFIDHSRGLIFETLGWGR